MAGSARRGGGRCAVHPSVDMQLFPVRRELASTDEPPWEPVALAALWAKNEATRVGLAGRLNSCVSNRNTQNTYTW